MSNKYLKPMLDQGSTRVFNCNELTGHILVKNPEADLFFRNRPLNGVIVIKDAMPPLDPRQKTLTVGTKIYFPFNVKNYYEGGRTIFVQDKGFEGALVDQYGEGALDKERLAADFAILKVLDRLPSLDPFLMKDAFIRNDIKVNPAYFAISEEAWQEIETFMLQRFESLVQAAFSEAMSSDEKARQLINKIWEARDLEALMPLIEAFRLPQGEALNIFSSWKGIVYYCFQYQKDKADFVALLQWVMASEQIGLTMPSSKETVAALRALKEQLRQEWQLIETIVRRYETSYDKMFRLKAGSADFLGFLRESNKIYWDIGCAIGKCSQAIYCWKVMTSRYNGKVPWTQCQEVTKILTVILPSEKKNNSVMAW